jgi:hypothetical protein
MDTRYLFSALAGVFCLFLIVAAITTYRYIENRSITAVHQTR